jgi:hypothetical protein
MIDVTTPRGSLSVSGHQVANARDRLFPLSAERRVIAGERANKVLERRDSRRAAAVVAALAGLTALAVPAAAL